MERMSVMPARDVMTGDVLSIGPETPAAEIARCLVERGVSAVPVVDAAGEPIGMVSEGDLIGRDDVKRDARGDWWLEMLADGHGLSADFADYIESGTKQARHIMAAPVIPVTEETPVQEVVRLLVTHRIKRVPVVRDGRMVGIVSRADQLQALAATSALAPARPARALPFGTAFESAFKALDKAFHREPARAHPDQLDEAALPKVSARDFRHLVEAFDDSKLDRAREVAETAAQQRSHQVKTLLDEHIESEHWRNLLNQAREAAERGDNELLLLRFPSELCSDGGRMINAPEPDWPSTLRGEAADLYLHWQHDLKPKGFGLAARVVEFPGGFPGDIGLFLTWGG